MKVHVLEQRSYNHPDFINFKVLEQISLRMMFSFDSWYLILIESIFYIRIFGGVVVIGSEIQNSKIIIFSRLENMANLNLGLSLYNCSSKGGPLFVFFCKQRNYKEFLYQKNSKCQHLVKLNENLKKVKKGEICKPAELLIPIFKK